METSTAWVTLLFVLSVLAGGWLLSAWFRRGHPIEGLIVGIFIAGLGVFLGNPALIMDTGKALSRLAWLLALAGAVAVLVTIPLGDVTRKAAPVAAAGVVVGVIAAVVFTVQAAGAGDDRRYIDATVASTVSMF